MEHPFLMFLAPRASNLLQMQTAAQILQTAAVLQRVMTHCRVWPTLRAHYFNIGDTVHQPHQPEHDQNIKIWINLTLVWTTKVQKNARSKRFAVYTLNLCHLIHNHKNFSGITYRCRFIFIQCLMLGGEWILWVSMFHSSRYSSIYYRLKTQESGEEEEEEGWINVFFFQRNLGCGLVCLIFAPLNSFLCRAKYCANSLFWWLTDRRYLCKKGKRYFRHLCADQFLRMINFMRPYISGLIVIHSPCHDQFEEKYHIKWFNLHCLRPIM